MPDIRPLLLSASALAAIAGLWFWVYESDLHSRALSELAAHTAASERNESAFRTVEANLNRSKRRKTELEKQLAGAVKPQGDSELEQRRKEMNKKAAARLASDPMLREKAVAAVKGLYLRRYGHFLDTRGLTDEQIDKVLDLLAHNATVAVGDNTVALAGLSPSADFAQQLVDATGDPNIVSAFQQYTRTYLAREAITDLAGNLYYTGFPLSSEQSDALMNIVANADPNYQQGGNASKAGVNWDQVLAQSKDLLSPSQYEALSDQAAMLKAKIWYTASTPGLPTRVLEMTTPSAPTP